MARLVVRALRCVVETDEVGDDDPYMIVFRGSFSLPPDVKVVGGKGSAWANMSTGEPARITDVVLDEPYSPENAYVVAMLEQDWNRDILTNGSWGKVAEFWANHWYNFTTPQGRELCAFTSLFVGGAIDNDEVLGVHSLPQIFQVGGDGVLLHFTGDGGHYRARFVKRT